MAKRRRPRVQRVALRERRREWIRRRLGGMVRRGVVASAAVGLSLGLLSQGDALLASRLAEWSPRVSVDAPAALTALPLAADFPSNRLWLWTPWVTARLESRWKKKFPVIRKVEFNRQLGERTLRIQLQPRKPLVRLNETTAMDEDGVPFAYSTLSLGPALPKLELQSVAARLETARWLQAMARQSVLWGKIVSIRQDRLGFYSLELQSGTKIVWGPPIEAEAGPKAQVALRALSDAQDHFKGTSLADLRFFSEGRIIVTPKR